MAGRRTDRTTGRRPGGEADHVAQPTTTDRGPGAAQRMFAADTASQSLGIELLSAGDGTAELAMTVTAAMVNGHGIAHGGYVFLLADTAFACACNSHGPVTVAAGADVTFVAPAREGDRLRATATERVRFGRSGVYDVTVLRGDEVIAEFRGHSRVYPAGPPPKPGGRP
ncbi:phenylacetic acid degradation protein PaaD [Streptomyces xinghaiensis]|uniref:Hydroxyphenylacetyl-CoA thioesterase PaaI n=2 Tax=Streptomyces TaxID=1883 RepID=A0A3M8FE59_9ACTN|nr:phenylacetic acid degradation protein PaaD [Streptomyces xinghaiensis]RKM99018.1 hydroxyphenylacetyl-CoA thioesterase PaaI [Streptomyces xinghaiensis]RNC76078.1 hydroxyphenylacetyl-CoA thioesterase PaaI [Streptomyces xinghaiensis]